MIKARRPRGVAAQASSAPCVAASWVAANRRAISSLAPPRNQNWKSQRCTSSSASRPGGNQNAEDVLGISHDACLAAAPRPRQTQRLTMTDRLPGQRLAQPLQQDARAVLAAAAVVVIVEEHALLGHGQARACALQLQRDRGQRDRDVPVVEVHVVAIDDALVRYDVVI